MIYLEYADLTAIIDERFIKELTGEAAPTGNTTLLVKQEIKAIAMAKSYLSARYDIEAIFDLTEPIRDEILVDIIAKIVAYRLIKRNAARKVPVDVDKDWDWAVKELGKINSGATKLALLPPKKDENGTPLSNTITGNKSNPDFYI